MIKKDIYGFGLLLAIILQIPVFSQSRHAFEEFLHCSHDMQIIRAFYKLENSGQEGAVDRIVTAKVRVLFKDLGTLNKHIKNYDALSWLSAQGQQLIFINEKHRNAPPEALAAMIAHESIHNDALNSLQEEIAGWRTEARTWHELKSKNPELEKIPQGTYALVDRLNQLEQANEQGTLDQLVRNNAGYRGLPETSPGFEEAALSSGQSIPPIK